MDEFGNKYPDQDQNVTAQNVIRNASQQNNSTGRYTSYYDTYDSKPEIPRSHPSPYNRTDNPITAPAFSEQYRQVVRKKSSVPAILGICFGLVTAAGGFFALRYFDSQNIDPAEHPPANTAAETTSAETEKAVEITTTANETVSAVNTEAVTEAAEKPNETVQPIVQKLRFGMSYEEVCKALNSTALLHTASMSVPGITYYFRMDSADEFDLPVPSMFFCEFDSNEKYLRNYGYQVGSDTSLVQRYIASDDDLYKYSDQVYSYMISAYGEPYATYDYDGAYMGAEWEIANGQYLWAVSGTNLWDIAGNRCITLSFSNDTMKSASDFFSTNAPASIIGYGTVITKDDPLNLRKSASTSAEIETKMPIDASVTVYSSCYQNGRQWYFVGYTDYDTFYTGYASSEYIKITEQV